MKGLLRRYLLHNLGLKAVSLAAAVVLWAVVGAEPAMETSISVPVEFHNVPQALELLSDTPPNIHLQVKGPSSKVRGLNRADVAVVLDLMRVQQPGARTFTLDQSRIALPRGVTVVRAMPSQLRLVFEKRLSRDVAVVPRFSGTYVPGYEIARYTVEPPELKVVGPESRLAVLDYATTDPIDVSKLIGGAVFTTNAYLDDSHLRFENLQSVRVNVEMKKR